MDLIDGYMVRTAGLALLAIFVTQVIPRTVRTIFNWTAAALFGTKTGRQRQAGLFFAAASIFWLFVLVSFAYAPAALAAPQVLPFPRGLITAIIVIELWLLLLLPAIVGAIEAYLSTGTPLYRLSMIPRAFVHIAAIAVALIVLVPWIIFRFGFVQVKRLKSEQFRIDIEPGLYDSVADALVVTLRAAGLNARLTELPLLVRISRFTLRRFGPPFMRDKGEYQARRIVGDGYWLIVFDGLIDALASKATLSRVRAGLIGKLPPRGLWLTQSDEAKELERYIRSEGADLSDVPRRIATLDASLEEWRLLSWEYTQVLVERDAREDAATVEADQIATA